MKTLILILASALTVAGADFPLAHLNNTQATNILSVATLTTNATGSAFEVGFNNYHTFQCINHGTNAVQIRLDRSLDGTNWVSWTTNNLGTNALTPDKLIDCTMVGKWFKVRARFFGTNSAAVVDYLGGK